MSLELRLLFAKETAKSAGDIALQYYKNIKQLTVVSKGMQDMATEADVETEAFIRGQVATAYPEDDFFGEESSGDFVSNGSSGVWVVDPIDGTQPFINGINSWCISMAYIVGRDIQIAVTYDPNNDEMFYSQRGKGAYLNDQKLTCATAQSFAEGLISIGYSNRVTVDQTVVPLRKILAQQGMFHRSGSGALSLAYVAAGRLLGYFEPHMNIWDSAAGILLVEEAGGRALSVTADSYFLQKGAPALAAAPGIYESLLEVVSCC